MGIPRCRLPAPPAWLAEQLLPGLDRRRRLVETCRAELVWARADWLERAAGQDGWQDACLPHEQRAADLLAIWGELHPVEDRLRRGLERLRGQRAARWDGAATRADVEHYGQTRRSLWQAYLAAAQRYRGARATLGWTVPDSGWPRQNARIAADLSRRAS